VKDFLAELCELSNYDTKRTVDAFEVGRRLDLQGEKIDRIVNYAIQKDWVSEPDRTFDRINNGDPPSSRKFRFISITSKGKDKQDEESEPSGIPQTHFGDIVTTNIHQPEHSPIQIGSKESTQNVVFSEGQI
jgi:hypothetical protein